MGVLRSVALAFSLFSRIPVPAVAWDDRGMRYLMAAFPLVGVVISLLMAMWWFVCDVADVGAFARAVGLVAVSVAVTGGIHMDGFCDTVDALSSHAEPERKRQILKDPHTGAFAVLGVSAYLLVQTAVLSELALARTSLLLLAAVPVASRALAGLAVLHVPRSSEGGMASSFQQAGAKGPVTAILIAVLAVCVVWLALIDVRCAVLTALASAACLAMFVRMVRREFGGMSGDLAGYLVQLLELVLPLCLVIVQKAVGLP